MSMGADRIGEINRRKHRKNGVRSKENCRKEEDEDEAEREEEEKEEDDKVGWTRSAAGEEEEEQSAKRRWIIIGCSGLLYVRIGLKGKKNS